MAEGTTIRVSGCEVCGSPNLTPVLDLGLHPLCDDLVPVGDSRVTQQYPIRIAFCPVCRTAHQMFQVPKRELFPVSYHYRAALTADVLNGMRQLVERCKAVVGDLAGKLVLDVGCNDGSLLSIFRENGARTIGIEPTGAAADARAAGHEVRQEFFTPELAESIAQSTGRPDIITFTNVFAHIEDLPAVLKGLNALMAPHTILVIENHYLGAVLDRYQFDTFYHEHPRTYSLSSFVHIARSLGATILAAEFPARYGGNIRVILRRDPGDAKAATLIEEQASAEAGFGDRLRDMGEKIPVWSAAKGSQLRDLASRFGPLSGKAFPGRAAILVKLLDLDTEVLGRVHEKPGSMKVGHYIPGTRIPILSDDDFASRPRPDGPLLNLAWHISAEIRGYMQRNGFAGEIIDILSPDEFREIA